MRTLFRVLLASTMAACLSAPALAAPRVPQSNGIAGTDVIAARALADIERATAGSRAARTADKSSDDGLDSRRFTLWIGGPFELDYRPGSSGSFTFAAGLGGVLSRSDDGFGGSETTLATGPIGDVYYYPNRRANGLALDLRVGSADGFYVAPGIYYVSRAKGAICGRFGIAAPIGGRAIPINVEAALGVRF
ncbi:MAG TPA: hypothetical protein VKT77_11795 [Chthonomonadaceae bacterium]|nr:hypothetical protein [Chthonomonadaceae bacterium]